MTYVITQNKTRSYLTAGKPYRLYKEWVALSGNIYGDIISEKLGVARISAQHPDGCLHLGGNHWQIVEKVPARVGIWRDAQ